MAKRDPKGNFGSPVTARMGEQIRLASSDVAQPAPPVVEPVDIPEPAQKPNGAAVEARRDEQGGQSTSTPAATPQRAEAPATVLPVMAVDAATTSIRIILDLAEREGLDALTTGLTKKLGSRVKLANLMRASIALLMEAQESIANRAEKMSSQVSKRPANDDPLALAQFEDQLKDVIAAGLFDSARRR